MRKFFVLIFLPGFLFAVGEQFYVSSVEELSFLIGVRKAKLVYLYINKQEINRLSELLNIDGVGKKTVIEMMEKWDIRLKYEPWQRCSLRFKNC